VGLHHQHGAAGGLPGVAGPVTAEFPAGTGDIQAVYDWLRLQDGQPDRIGGDRFLDAVDWNKAAFYISSHQIVPATDLEPSMFWFEGRRFRVRRP
jgi:hypothetical protein